MVEKNSESRLRKRQSNLRCKAKFRRNDQDKLMNNCFSGEIKREVQAKKIEVLQIENVKNWKNRNKDYSNK